MARFILCLFFAVLHAGEGYCVYRRCLSSFVASYLGHSHSDDHLNAGQ